MRYAHVQNVDVPKEARYPHAFLLMVPYFLAKTKVCVNGFCTEVTSVYCSLIVVGTLATVKHERYNYERSSLTIANNALANTPMRTPSSQHRERRTLAFRTTTSYGTVTTTD